MTHIIYLNGAYVHSPYAKTHINDRGYQFADAAYEVVLCIKNTWFDMDLHLDRLNKTLDALKINFTMSRQALIMNMKSLMQKNHIQTGMVYIQISRGVASRNFPFPKESIKPTLVMTARSLNYDMLLKQKHKKLALTLLPDNRWGRCDLKTVGLLPSVLATQQAIDSGFDDALFFDQKGITEGTSWNFWIVNKEGHLQTRPLGNEILHGITRHTILKIAQAKKMSLIEAPITIDDLKTAQECFATSATKMVMPVKSIDDITYRDATPIVDMLNEAYLEFFL
jgi:D-alanine transaminase